MPFVPLYSIVPFICIKFSMMPFKFPCLFFSCLFLSYFLSGLPWGLQLPSLIQSNSVWYQFNLNSTAKFCSCRGPSPSFVLLRHTKYKVQITFYTLHDRQHRFIITALCNCLLNWVGEKKIYKQKVHLYCLLYYVVILSMFFISLCGFELLSNVFNLGLKDSL